MSPPRILIACIGNIFLGDDAFGVAVAQRLAHHPLPDGVRVVDFGIRGLDLTYALLERYDAVLLVDATPRGGPPGTLYVIEPDTSDVHPPQATALLIEPHNLDPAKVLRLVTALGGQINRLLLLGCEPSPLPEDEMTLGLTPPVQAAIDQAIPLIDSLLTDLVGSVSEPPNTVVPANNVLGSLTDHSHTKGESVP